ncbi:MAG TPA: InlB B-repeat-containing protein, partial [Tissierellaceae bacterium]|nr:InlB B-repeat-containing protein [Tissierellaceae bacterium]
ATYSSVTNEYTVTFVDENGTTVLKTEEVEYGNAATAPAEPTRTGYTFSGWDVEFDNVIEDITVTAHYAINQYTITFNSDGGSEVADVTADFGAAITEPTAPTKEGYTFDKWVDGEGREVTFPETMPVDGLSLKATWTTNTDTAYTVEHHQQNINDDGYTVFETETKSGTTDTTTAETAKEYTGFKAGVVTNVNINGDGSAVVVIKYDRETYEVKFADYDNQQLGETQTVRYEGSATAPEDPKREGYIFAGWDKEFDNIIANLTVKATYKLVLNYDGETEIIVAYGAEFTIPEVTATDNVDGPVDVTSVITDADSNVIETIDTTVAGAYTITYSAVDAAGNEAEELEISVLVAPVVKNEEKGKFYFNENNGLAMALSEAVSGDVVILLSDHILSESATIKDGVTLLLPFKSIDTFSDEEDPTSIKETSPGPNADTIDRDNPYIVLSMPENTILSVNGTLTVNAQRTAGTPRAGYVVAGNYTRIDMDNGSRINVNSGGTLNSIGFITGQGKVEAESGATIQEPMFIKSFRGGSTTASVGLDGDVFPFTQFTINHIEVDLTINEGANHIADALLHASSRYAKGDLNLIGSTEEDLIQLSADGQIIRTYDTGTGKVKFDLRKGTASINNASINADGITADSKGMDMPMDGTWSFNVGSGTELNINSWVMLLPGSEMNVENGGILTVNPSGKLTIYNPYEYLDNYANGKYPARVINHYRVAPDFGYDAFTFTKFNVDGTLIVKAEASIAGKLSGNGQFNISGDAITEYDVYYVWDASAKKRNVKLWYEGDSTIAAVSDKDYAKYTDKDGVTITATVRDPNGNLLEGIEVVFSSEGSGTWDDEQGSTGADGKVTAKYTLSDEDSGTIKLKFTAKIGDGEITTVTNVIEGAKPSCPLVYSYDGEEHHLEHEPVPYSVGKAFETISHGTLRKLQEVDGQYNVRITEEMESTTFVNGFNLYAVDYLENSSIEEVFVDIFGTPHTIKDRKLPISFIDSKGKSWLDEISTKNQLVSSDSSMFEQGEDIESYEAVFNRPEGSIDIAKFMISTKVNNIVDGFGKWFYDVIDGQNNIWWLENAIELSPHFEKFTDTMNMINLKVDLWDGSNWVAQGEIAGGSNLLEEHLVPLDLSIINGNTDDIKVRIRGGAGFFEIDEVSMDFSKDEIENIQKLDLDSALKNGTEEVSHIIGNLNNEQRVKLQKGEDIDLYYN